MAYSCPKAIFKGPRDTIRCEVSGEACAHQRMCMMEGRVVLSDGALRCPGRRWSAGESEGNGPGAGAGENGAGERPGIPAAAPVDAEAHGRNTAAASNGAKDAEKKPAEKKAGAKPAANGSGTGKPATKKTDAGAKESGVGKATTKKTGAKPAKGTGTKPAAKKTAGKAVKKPAGGK